MQIEHWQLAESPFGTLLDPRRYYPSASHDEALARLEYLVDARRRLGALVGESGVGKSLVVRVAAERLARRGAAVATIDVAGASTREFLWQLAAALGAAPRDAADVVQLWRQIADRVAENRLQQTSTLLLIDNAGEAGPDVLTQIARLTRLDSSPDARWTIVLVAAPAEAARWNESLREQVDLRVDLEPWNESETIGYIQTALVDAGRCDPVFLDEALLAIFALTHGVPRRVVRLAELALIAGAAAGVERIDAELVHNSNGEMSWPKLEAAY